MTNWAGRAGLVSLPSLACFLLAASTQAQTDNTATGFQALLNNTTGDRNTATGVKSLRDNTSGSDNTATGRGSLLNNTSGERNTAFGQAALYWNSSGAWNTAVGFEALSSILQGSGNTAIGFQAMLSAPGGVANTGVGTVSLGAISSGGLNTAVGYGAGPSSDLTNTGAFGAVATPTASNTIRIGDNSITSIGGIVGWTTLSDARFKTGVTENVPGLDFVQKLRPVTFHWDLDKLDAFMGREVLMSDEVTGPARMAKEAIAYTGFLAQDVESAARECGFDFSGVVEPPNEKSVYQLSYAEFVVPLVKAVQEQQKEIEDLRSAVRRLASNVHRSDRSQHAGVADNLWGGALGIIGAVLALFYAKRARLSASPSRPH